MRLARVSTPLPIYAAARFLKFTEDCRGNTAARQLYIRKLRARCINRASASPRVFNKFCSPGIRFRTMLHEYSISIGTSKLRANERNVDRNKFIIAQGDQPWRRGDKFASGNGEKFPYRPNRFDSKHRDAIFVPPGYIFFFLFPSFFPHPLFPLHSFLLFAFRATRLE